jgi:DegV family protein with EDD domain
MIKIVVDSACDLPPELLEEYDISVVPINIQFGQETYADGVDLDRPTFFRKIEEMGLPKTSQPSPNQFVAHYMRLVAEGATEILSIHVTSKLSGTYQSAVMAKELVADKVRVHTFDTAAGSAGIGFMALEAARVLRAAGKTVNEALVRLEEVRPRVNIAFIMEDLSYAQMSGRVGRLQGSLASLLNVKPLVLLEDGLIDVSEKVRTRRRAIDRMIEVIAERVGTSEPVNLAAVHGEVPEDGRVLLDKAKSVFDCQESFLVNLTTTLVVHLGPGTLGLVAYRA